MRRLLSTPLRREFLFLVFLPCCFWVFCFRQFIFGAILPDVGDGSYYQQTLFFINNIIRGVYPLWDPTFFDGAPYDFFLRRIGDGNPFYLLIAALKLAGVADLHAYRIFLGMYYFLAVTGFWLIARMLLRDRIAYTGAFLLLLFSGWGTRVFADYIILLLVPLIWFFYFLVAFALQKKKHQFLGMFFAAAIGLTTYIPFFFVTVVTVFVLLFILFFWKETAAVVKESVRFINNNRVFTAGCLIFFLIALAPALDFFRESKRGEFVMPGRNVGTAETSALALSMDHVKVGDLMAQGYFDKTFAWHKDLKPIDFFVVYFFFLAAIVALVNPMRRAPMFLLANVIVLGVIAVTDTTPVYKFLYDHIFLFKYMRMMSFFFWIAAFPMALLFIAWQVDIFLAEYRGKRNPYLLAFIAVVHIAFGVWALRQEGAALTVGVELAASFIFFAGVVTGRLNSRALLATLFIALAVRPVEMSWYAAKNSPVFTEAASRFQLITDGRFPFRQKDVATAPSSVPKGGIYCGVKWYQELYVNVPERLRSAFTSNKLYLADNTALAQGPLPAVFSRMIRAWQDKSNIVFLSGEGMKPEDVRALAPGGALTVIDERTPFVKSVKADVNSLRMSIKLDRPRFLLWADNYHSGWHVLINGKEQRLLRADHAFKGVWLSSGDNAVLFRFATPWRSLAGYLVIIVFALALAVLVLSSRREGFLAERSRPS